MVATMRPPAMEGLSSIPLDKIVWYAEERLKFDEELTAIFEAVVTEFDRVANAFHDDKEWEYDMEDTDGDSSSDDAG